MRVYAYDFDGTIYDGDSSVDFYKYCLKQNKSICKYWLKLAWYLGLYVLGKKSKTEVKEVFFCFLKDFDDKEELLDSFWNEHFSKIKKWYLDKSHENDIIISASPEFLLKKVAEKLGTKDLIASVVNIENGKFLKENCHGMEKVKRLKEKYKEIYIEEMYTDSTSDLPMIEMAKKGFMVKKDTIIPYEDYRPSFIKKLKTIFFTPKFLRFIFVGCLNTFNGVLFSFLYSLIINNAVIAFIIGYITSLVISYLLNSYITFRDNNLGISKFIKFCISYIPNFLIQLICVYIFIDVLHLYKLVAYIISAIIGIPITYIALLILPFKNNNKD